MSYWTDRELTIKDVIKNPKLAKEKYDLAAKIIKQSKKVKCHSTT